MIGVKPPSRLRDPRFIVGVLLFLLTSLITAVFIGALNRMDDYYVADRTLLPGDTLQAKALRVERINPGHAADKYVAVGQIDTAMRVLEPIRPGELIPRRAVSGRDAKLRLVVLTLSTDLPESARTGDRFELWTLGIPETSVRESSGAFRLAENAVLVSQESKGRHRIGEHSAEMLITREQLPLVLEALGKKIPIVAVAGADIARSADVDAAEGSYE